MRPDFCSVGSKLLLLSGLLCENEGWPTIRGPPGQRNAHAPSAREGLCGAPLRRCIKRQPRQDGGRPRLSACASISSSRLYTCGQGSICMRDRVSVTCIKAGSGTPELPLGFRLHQQPQSLGMSPGTIGWWHQLRHWPWQAAMRPADWADGWADRTVALQVLCRSHERPWPCRFGCCLKPCWLPLCQLQLIRLAALLQDGLRLLLPAVLPPPASTSMHLSWRIGH